jgi:hypothetical protein
MQPYAYSDLQDLFTFPFRDQLWKNKFLIGALLYFAGLLIPIIPWIFLSGYSMQMMRRIIQENGDPFLPEWNDWNRYLIDGLKQIGVGFIYMLPFITLFFIGYGLMVLPQMIFSIMASSSQSSPPAWEFLFPFVGMAIGWIFFGVGMAGFMSVGLVLPVSIGHMVATDQFAAAFRIKEWWPIFRANLSGFLVAYVVILGASMVLNIATQILYFSVIFCCLMPFAMSGIMIYLMTVWSTLMAQTYRTGVLKLAAQKEPQA